MNLFRSSKHKGSDLLTKDDNNKIFDHVGRNNQILLMTVIELHRSPNSSGEGDWKKEEIGVLCLVQDLHKKCYFFRIFCLLRKRIVWEYEINKSMRYSTPKSFLHSFQAEDCMYAFYFVSEREAGLLAVHMNEISINLLEIEQRSARYKIHEINPVVETPRRRILYSNFNKNKDCFSTDSSRLPSPFRLFRMFLNNTEARKKKEVTSEDIANPEHFEHISHISEFKEKLNQIQRNKKKDETLLEIPISESMLKPSSTLSESVLPVFNETSNRLNSALQNEKSPRLSDRFFTFRHPGEDATPRIEIKPSFSENFVTSVPPLPPKKSPRFNRRPFSSNPSNSSKIENGSLSHSSCELKSSNFEHSHSHLGLNLIGVPTVRSISEITATEVKHCNLNSRHRVDHSYVNETTLPDYDFPYPSRHPLPQKVSEKRKPYDADDLHHSDPNICHYDVVSGEPRPVSTLLFNSLSCIELGKDSPSNISGRESPTFLNSSSVNATVRRNSNEVVRISGVTPKLYKVTPVTTQHPFLLFPSFTRSSVSLPSDSAPLRRDDIRAALNLAIKSGVQLKRTDGIRRKSFSRENND